MKPLLIAIIILNSFLAKANDNPSYIAPAAISAFHNAFKNYSNEKWTTVQSLYRVEFLHNGQRLYAFYNVEGHQLCVIRKLAVKQLPFALQMQLMHRYNSLQLTDLFELSDENGTSYYAEVTTNKHLIMLKASAGYEWHIHEKNRIKQR